MAIDDLQPLFGPGQRLGRYELTQRLAVGGMAEVYLAVASGAGDFRKVVAIKRMLPQHALDPQLLRMFLDEARLMARLSHPNVAQVTDVGEGGGVEVPYFVMEYSHGTDLRGVLNAAAGPLPIEHALAIASAVAAGLHHAHEQRGENGQPLEIVHRDISPSNILISFNGGVRVTDFGVAKWADQRSFTHNGQLKGKFAHMSPEQCRGEALDRRSDIFALGTLLYEMITGHSPFVADSEYELLTQIISRDAPLPERPDGEIPAQLAFIITRSLRRARDDRYPTAQALQLDLEAFAREHKLVVSPVALAGYLESLFGARVIEWRQAWESGQTQADHLVMGSASNGTRALLNSHATEQARMTASATASAATTTAASATRRTTERTATDTFSVRAEPGVTITPRIPVAQVRAISRKQVFAGALVVALAMATATATALKMRRSPPPTVRTPAQSTAMTSVPAPTIASRATATDTFQAPRSSPASTSQSSPPPGLPRATRRTRVVSRATSDAGPAGSPSRAASNTPFGAPSATTTTPPIATPPSTTATLAITSTPAVTPSTAAATPAGRPAARAVPAPLKVWDPDSPVPP